jgi:hypothetical protein
MLPGGVDSDISLVISNRLIILMSPDLPRWPVHTEHVFVIVFALSADFAGIIIFRPIATGAVPENLVCRSYLVGEYVACAERFGCRRTGSLCGVHVAGVGFQREQCAETPGRTAEHRPYIGYSSLRDKERGTLGMEEVTELGAVDIAVFRCITLHYCEYGAYELYRIDFVAEPDFPDVEWALYGIVDVRCHISIYALVIGIYDYLGDKHILMPDELISELAHGTERRVIRIIDGYHVKRAHIRASSIGLGD